MPSSSQALNTLLELIQGPCHDNQVALVRSSFLSVTQRMLDSLRFRDEHAPAGAASPPLRVPPTVIAHGLSYTAVGDHAAGNLDCPPVSEGERGWGVGGEGGREKGAEKGVRRKHRGMEGGRKGG